MAAFGVAAVVFGGAWQAVVAATPPAVDTTALPWLVATQLALAAAAAVIAPTRPDPERWRWGALAWASGALLALLVVRDQPFVAQGEDAGGWLSRLALASAVLWGVGHGVERWLDRRLPALTAAMVAVSIASATVVLAKPVDEVVVERSSIRTWNVYHYYVGSKYFGELGYHDLYAATLAADDLALAERRTPHLAFVDRTRDMHSYAVVGRDVATRHVTTDADTLRAMHADLRALIPWEAPGTWEAILTDLGYNPAPVWPFVGGLLARVLSPEGWQLHLLTNLDLPLFALSLAALLWGWGPRVTAGAVTFTVLVAFNDQRLLGGFLQYDWLATLVGGMACWRRGWHATGGALLSYAAMTRVFPGFLVFPLLFDLAVAAWRRQGLPRPALRFAGSFTLACALWFALSHTTGRGLHTWPEWVQAISVHSQLHGTIGRARLGLGRLGAHAPSPDDVWGAVPRSHSPKVAATAAAKVRPWRVLGGLLLLAALVRRRPEDRMLAMLVAAWIGVVTSRYYGTAWLLLLALGLPERGDAGRRQHPAGWIAAVGVLALPAVFRHGRGNEQIYFEVNYWFALTLGLALLVWLADDLRRARPATTPSPASPPA